MTSGSLFKNTRLKTPALDKDQIRMSGLRLSVVVKEWKRISVYQVILCMLSNLFSTTTITLKNMYYYLVFQIGEAIFRELKLRKVKQLLTHTQVV
jgi:hypothetical protein